MGTYRNPDPVIANTGSAVYAGIQKLAGDVYNFANAERKRKGEIIGKSLAERQAIDDDVNKLGLNIGEGASPMDKQVFEEAQATKQKIAEQYNLMARTFATPTQIAESKAEIARLNKYPEQLIADLSTGKYLVDQYNEAIRNAPGSEGAISMANNADVLQVIQDMRDGGKNTTLETGASGARSLVTTIDGKKSELNITSITNGLKSDPDYQLFKNVVDDSSTADTFKAAAFGPKPNKLDLISSGVLIENKETNTAGMVITSYTVDDRIAKAPVNKLADSLIDDPKNYDYVNSIWQDKMGVTGDINLAIEKFGKDKVKEEIVNHYYEQVKKNLSGDLGGLTFKTAAASFAEKETYYSTDDQFDLLASAKKGEKIVKIGSELYMSDGENIGIAMTGPDGGSYTLNQQRSVPLKNSDGSFNYSGFSTISGGKAETRDVKKEASTTTGTGDVSTATEEEKEVELNIGGNTVTTTTEGNTTANTSGETKSETQKLLDDATSDASSTEDVKLVNEKTREELKKLEEKVVSLKESLKEGGYEKEKEEAIFNAANEQADVIYDQETEATKEKFSIPLTEFRAGVRKGEITIEDVDTKIKILNAQFKKGDISKAKYKKDIKFINEKIMSLLPEDIPGGKKIDKAMIANQLKQDKKDLDSRKLNPGDFPSESSGSIVEVNQEQKNELEIKEAVVETPKATIASKDKFIELKGSLSFPLVGGRGDSKLFRKQGEVKHESIPGIKLKSNGLQFDVKEGSQAASVGEGKVVAIQQSDDGTKTVMVEHEGGYISVYGPLGTLGVKKGDAINKNTSLGKVYTKKVGDGPKTVLKFQIWKDNKAINPEEWLG